MYKTITYSNVAEMVGALRHFHTGVKMRSDDSERMAVGYFTAPSFDSPDEQWEHHIAPLHGSLEPCKKIFHNSRESFDIAWKNCQHNGEKTQHADDVKRLLYGFTAHPSREWHLLDCKK